MKLTRLLAFALMLLIATTPAVAAVCALQCAGEEVQAAMMDMPGCHEHEQNTDQSDQQHKHCNMAGCHFSPVALPDMKSQHDFLFPAESSFLRYHPSAFSAELAPPIKPPA